MTKDVAVIPLDGTVPSYITKAFSDGEPTVNQELSDGVQAGFPVLSIRGKVWRVKIGAQETALLNSQKEPLSSLNMVIIKANKAISKIYYAKQFSEGDDAAPDCFSNDGVLPDPSVSEPFSPTCAACPNNRWGSRITEQGQKVKACADSRRLAVLPSGDLDAKIWESPLLLRIPAASLAALYDYAKDLTNRGVGYQMVVTKFSFDTDASYPKILFENIGYLPEESFNKVTTWASSDIAKLITAGIEPTTPAPVAADTAAKPPAAKPPAVEEPAKAKSGNGRRKRKKAEPNSGEQIEMPLGNQADDDNVTGSAFEGDAGEPKANSEPDNEELDEVESELDDKLAAMMNSIGS